MIDKVMEEFLLWLVFIKGISPGVILDKTILFKLLDEFEIYCKNARGERI